MSAAKDVCVRGVGVDWRVQGASVGVCGSAWGASRMTAIAGCGPPVALLTTPTSVAEQPCFGGDSGVLGGWGWMLTTLLTRC